MRARASGGNEAGALREARKLQIWLSSGNFPRASLFRRRRRRRFFSLSPMRAAYIYVCAFLYSFHVHCFRGRVIPPELFCMRSRGERATGGFFLRIAYTGAHACARTHDSSI